MTSIARPLAAALCLSPLLCLPAAAHVTLADPTAVAGRYYTSAFRVTHGCAGAATTALRIEIPAAIVLAKPQPKPGWSVEIERAPLPTPVAGEGGKMITQRVSAITWRGRLPDEDWDQFGLMAKLPDAPGLLYFPAVQTCETGESRWTEQPTPGGKARLAHPAPALTLTMPADTSGDMPGMDMRQH